MEGLPVWLIAALVPHQKPFFLESTQTGATICSISRESCLPSCFFLLCSSLSLSCSALSLHTSSWWRFVKMDLRSSHWSLGGGGGGGLTPLLKVQESSCTLYIPPPLIKFLLYKGESLCLSLLPESLDPLPHLGLSLQHRLLPAGHLTCVLLLFMLQQCSQPRRSINGGRARLPTSSTFLTFANESLPHDIWSISTIKTSGCNFQLVGQWNLKQQAQNL